MSTKKEQRALKRPDLFQTRGREFLENQKQNPKGIISVLAILFIAIAGYFFSQYWSNQQIEKRASELWSVDKTYQEELTAFQALAEAEGKKIDALETKLEELQKDDKAAKKNKSQIDKLNEEIDALEKIAAAAKPNHEKSSEAYLAFFKKYSDTPEGHRAAIHVINYLTQSNKIEKAQELTAKVLEKMKPSAFFYTSLSRLNIKLLSELTHLDSALSEAEKLLAKSPDKEKPQALLLKGTILLQAEKEEEAEKIFDSVIAHFHATGETKSLARAYKALIF